MTTFNAKTNLANFSRSLGNGITMGKEFAAGLHHAIATKTQTILRIYTAAQKLKMVVIARRNVSLNQQ